MIAFFLFTSLIAISSALQDGKLGRIPIRSRPGFSLDNGGIDEKLLFSALNATLEKYNVNFVLPPFQELRLNANFTKRQHNQALADDEDLAYDAPITIGSTNPQSFSMDFDTGRPSSPSSPLLLPKSHSLLTHPSQDHPTS